MIMISFGSESTKKQGQKLISNLLKGKAPKNFDNPPIEFRQQLWDEYFPRDPSDNTNTIDTLKLGSIERPQE